MLQRNNFILNVSTYNLKKKIIVVVQSCPCAPGTVLWVRSQLEEMKYLFKFIFPFLRSNVEPNRGFELGHSTCNECGKREVLKPCSLCHTRYAVCGIQCELI